MKQVAWLFLLLPVSAIGQLEHSLLWKVTRTENTHTSYLFGSMHTNDSVANTFSDAWWQAFESCNVVASEVNMLEATDPTLILSYALMKDTLLRDLYGEQDYKIVRNLLAKEFDTTLVELLDRMKPFHVLALIMENPDDGESFQTVMDIRLQALALKRGKAILGLETPEEQAKSIDVLNLQEQADLLLDYAKTEGKVDDFYDDLKSFYLAQNLDSLSDTQITPHFPEKLVRELVSGRNQRFLKSLLQSIDQHNIFCIVGAMHLVGEDGLIAGLRKEGYVVEPVTFYFGMAQNPTGK